VSPTTPIDLIDAARLVTRGGFRPALEEQQGGYRLRFATAEADLEAALRLRYEVFNRELGEGLAASEATGLDRDEFDAQCDHLLVEERRTGRVIGTYRMQVAEMANAGAGFYSATEFEFGHVPAGFLDEAIELGRACIAREHRNTKVLFLLWRGLASYVLWNGRRYLLGCSSLTSQDPEEGLRAFDQLAAEGHLHPTLAIPPRPDYACVADGPVASGRKVPIPRLFHTYLRYGAKICGAPAIDRWFGTIDFLTLLDVGAMDARLFAMFSAGLEGARR
jgi:putative hemolysin